MLPSAAGCGCTSAAGSSRTAWWTRTTAGGSAPCWATRCRPTSSAPTTAYAVPCRATPVLQLSPAQLWWCLVDVQRRRHEEALHSLVGQCGLRALSWSGLVWSCSGPHTSQVVTREPLIYVDFLDPKDCKYAGAHQRRCVIFTPRELQNQ